jgi:hypothetical protein
MIELFLIAQEFSGCFWIDEMGRHIDLTSLCLGNRQEMVVPSQEQRLTSVEIYRHVYRREYCQFVGEGMPERMATQNAHDIATNEVIRLRGELDDEIMDSETIFDPVNCN